MENRLPGLIFFRTFAARPASATTLPLPSHPPDALCPNPIFSALSCMQLQTPVDLPLRAPRLSPGTPVLLLGSCFAAHIGERLSAVLNTDASASDRCSANPFGVLYNPRSICQALHLLAAPHEEMLQRISESLFQGRDGIWHSWLFSTLFSGSTREEAFQRMVQSANAARCLTASASPIIILTFGTDHHYALAKHPDMVVANCHKELPDTFIEKTDDAGSLQTLLATTLTHLHDRCPSVSFILTVSPYRYRKYGFHASMLGKARLLLMCEKAMSTWPDATYYFPAYEIMNDELRDYRFYRPDMLHPSEQAVEYIAERFEGWCFTTEMKAIAEERRRAMRRMAHRSIVLSHT